MYESFYLRAVSPEEPVGVWIRYTVHKRPGARRHRLALVHRLRRPPRTAVHAQADRRGTSTCPPEGGSDGGRRAHDAHERRGQHAGRRVVAAVRLRGARIAPPSVGLALPGAAAADQAHEPGAGGEVRRRRRAAGAEDDRAARLAGDGRPQLGLRARRALDLDAWPRFRRGRRRHGWTSRSAA